MWPVKTSQFPRRKGERMVLSTHEPAAPAPSTNSLSALVYREVTWDLRWAGELVSLPWAPASKMFKRMRTAGRQRRSIFTAWRELLREPGGGQSFSQPSGGVGNEEGAELGSVPFKANSPTPQRPLPAPRLPASVCWGPKAQ